MDFKIKTNIIRKLCNAGAVFFLLLSGGFLQGCSKQVVQPNTGTAGFDVDDTLLFSTPAFEKGFGSRTRPFSEEFWYIINTSDRGNSIIKKKTRSILQEYINAGSTVYIITSRHSNGGEVLKEYLEEIFDVSGENVFFEPDGKAGRIQQLGIDVFYGDSDSDMRDAMAAGAIPCRIQRAEKSSYKKNYNPGKYGEKIIKDSEW